MPSAVAAIWAAIDARLSALTLPGGYERMPSSDPDAYPALQGFDEGERPIESEPGSTRLALGITIIGYVERQGGAAAHDELVDLHASAVHALCGDGTLGGLVEVIEISGARRVDVAELASKRRLAFAQPFEIQFATVRGDPSTFA